MTLTKENYETKHNEFWNECEEYHQRWLDSDDDGTVDRYTDDDVHDDSYTMTFEYFMDLGYSEEQIRKIHLA